jgi:hypothetical protein
MMIIVEAPARSREDIATMIAYITMTEDIDTTQDVNMEIGINVRRSVTACQRVITPMEASGRKTPWTGSTGNRTMMEILSTTTSLPRADQRGEFLEVSLRNEKPYDE